MLEFYKTILEKVSFDALLFEKELKKSFNYLLPEEIDELLKWSESNFGNIYPEIFSGLQNQEK